MAASLPPPPGPIRILSIDGGAMKGVIPARILSYFDGSAATFNGNVAPVTGTAPLDDGITGTFDVVAGTSTGGILAAGLTIAELNGTLNRGNDLLNFYLDQGPNIFGPQVQNAVYPLGGPMFLDFDATLQYGIGPVLRRVFGSSLLDPTWRTLADSVVAEVIITSFNNASDGVLPYGPFLATKETPGPGNQASLSAHQACLMTSAFPMLLPPVLWQKDGADYFLDGGVWAGDPTLAVYLWARSRGYTDITLLSVGCGAYAPPVAPDYVTASLYGMGSAGLADMLHVPVIPNIPGWLMTAELTSATGKPWNFSELAALLTSGPGMYYDAMLTQSLGAAKYLRINPEKMSDQSEYPPYVYTPDALEFWVQQADAAVANAVSSGAYAAILQSLNTPS